MPTFSIPLTCPERQKLGSHARADKHGRRNTVQKEQRTAMRWRLKKKKKKLRRRTKEKR